MTDPEGESGHGIEEYFEGIFKAIVHGFLGLINSILGNNKKE